MCQHHPRCTQNYNSCNSHRDVNLLVSISAFKIGTKTISDYRTRGFIPNPGFKPQNGIDKNNDKQNSILKDTSKINRKINRILEATASLAVADARWQVVAVALHIDNTTLTIAENCALAAGLAEHIGELWGMLHEIAPASPNNEQKLKFFKYAYCYSVSKNLKRYNKWIPRLSLFLSAVPAVPEMSSFIAKLREIVVTLKATHVLLQGMEAEKNLKKDRKRPTGSLDDRDLLIAHTSTVEWGSLMQRMDDVLKDYRSMLKDFEQYYPPREYSSPRNVYPPLDWLKALAEFDEELEGNRPDLEHLGLEKKCDLEAWVKSVKADPDPFLLTHTLETLTTQHRHIAKLLSAPGDSSLSRLFKSPMTIVPVPATDHVEIILPKNEAELSPLIRAVYESVKPRIPTELITREVNELWPKLPKTEKEKFYGVVHCECALVAYLENLQNQDKEKPNYTDVSKQYNYIGVSKPSCGACNAWLAAFNKTRDTGRTWYTSGCHGKWYTPWAIPPAFDFADLKDAMAKIVCEEFVRYCNPRVNANTHDFTGSVNP